MDITPLIERIFSLKKSHFETYKETARTIIHQRLQYWAPICGVAYKRVTIRNQRKRWGSCSSKGNLNFNYRLIFLPSTLCDYVIVHELCHLKELNHDAAFWKEVGKVLPEYRTLEAELRLVENSHGEHLRRDNFIPVLDSYFIRKQKELSFVKEE
jgi:predicted metal-dependent hydrolase